MSLSDAPAAWAKIDRILMHDGAPEVSRRRVAGCFVLFVAAWTLYGSIAGAGHALHGDLAEAYAWGREFQLGYSQHPPFWAWIAGAWFEVFPRQDWAFRLLAMLNAGLGLLGCWQLIGLFAQGWQRRAAFALLLLTPLYTFLAFKYNANSIFLSLWPWTLYAFVRTLERRRRGDAVLFGAMAALSLLSKYYAVILLATCLVASLQHPKRRSYWRSPSPYIAIAVCCVLVLPHALWLLAAATPAGDATPIGYALDIANMGFVRALRSAVSTVTIEALDHILVVAAILVALWRGGRAPRQTLAEPAERRLIAVLTLLPIGLTVAAGLIFELKLSAGMMIGCFPLLPLWLIERPGAPDPRRLARYAEAAAVAISAAVLVLSPAIAYVNFAFSSLDTAKEPYRELAQAATDIWHQEVGTPLRLVGGSSPFEEMVEFYSPDHPRALIATNFAKAPWITPQQIAAEGIIGVCTLNEWYCRQVLDPLVFKAGGHILMITLQHEFWGVKKPTVSFDIYVVPPQHR